METHTIIGTLDRPPHVGTSKNGKEFVAFTIASTRDGFGGDKKFTSYHGCVCFGRSIETAKRVSVGDTIVVTSDCARTEIFTGKDGTPKSKVTFDVQAIEIIGAGGGATQPARPVSSPKPEAKAPAKTEAGKDLDEPPF